MLVKLKILLVLVLGVAGVGSSFALASSGKHDGKRDTSTGTTTSCQPTFVVGTAAPQNLVVTVQKSGWKNSPFAPGQVVTVSVGAPGSTVQVVAGGCVSGQTLTARGASIHVPFDHKPPTGGNGNGPSFFGDHHHKKGGPTTTSTTTTSSTTTTTG